MTPKVEFLPLKTRLLIEIRNMERDIINGDLHIKQLATLLEKGREYAEITKPGHHQFLNLN